ncbi:unnamed protein product, partial [Effrenium voratum]
MASDCGKAWRLNLSQPVPSQPLSSECASCRSSAAQFRVPWGHVAARCLREARASAPIAVDATETLGGINQGDARVVVLDFMRFCASRSVSRLYWVLQMNGIILGAASLGDTRHAMALCVPKVCSHHLAAAWLAAMYLRSGSLEGIAAFREDPFADCGDGTVLLPPRYALLAQHNVGFQALAAGQDAPPWPIWAMHFEDPALGSQGRTVFFSVLEQPLPPLLPPGRPKHPPAKAAAGAAVLLAGRWRYCERTVASIARHVTRPLEAVVVAVQSGTSAGGGRAAKAQLRRFFALAAFRWVRDDPAEERLQRLLAQKQLSADSGLVVCCFQEVWSFPKGPLMEYTASLDESRTSARWEGFVLVLGILFRAFACGRIWDAAQRLFDVPSDEAEAAKARINYAAVVGNRGMSLPCRALVDSGLCIFATKEPSDQGFFPYTSYPSGLHEERLANKGLMWAFWKSDASGVLVLNTHLSTEAVQTE